MWKSQKKLSFHGALSHPFFGVPKGTGEVTLGLTQTLGAGACPEQKTPLGAGGSRGFSSHECLTRDSSQCHQKSKYLGYKMSRRDPWGQWVQKAG